MTQNSEETKKKRNAKRNEYKHLKDIVEKYIIRVCIDCKEKKQCRFNSTFNIHGKPEYRPRCDDCNKIKEKEWQKKGREGISFSRKINNRKRKEKCVQYLGGKCNKCGYNKCNRALTFHHKDRQLKEYSIGQIMDYSWEIRKKELDKCELLCFNCHMEEEDAIESEKINEFLSTKRTKDR